jgi:hypothetical protein
VENEMSFAPPVIKLEIQQMHYSMANAISQHFAEMDAWVQEAIEKYCSDDSVKALIEIETKKALHKLVSEEVANYFFIEPEGRAIIRTAIRKKLQEAEDLDLPSDKSQDLDK